MHQNLIRIRAVNEQLKDLGQEFVFVGGATVSLYATESALATEIRPTDDVDVVIRLTKLAGKRVSIFETKTKTPNSF